MADRATIADVAERAGVSLMTVSRVINDKEGVSPATRERVQQAISELDYRPSEIARGLATQRTGTLGLVIPDVSNPFFADVAHGIEQRAYAAGYHVFLANTGEDPGRELGILQSLEDRQVDGLILCSSRLDEEQLRQALPRFAAVVLVNRPLAGSEANSVLIDDLLGGRLAAEHLIRTGRRRIGLLAGPPNSHSGRQRIAAYREALAEAGLDHQAEWVAACRPDVAGGQQAARALLARYPELDALICYNDLVAVGVLKTCAEIGRRVPAELAVVGYDDIALAQLVTPPLTTCRVPRAALGEQAVALLLARIENEPAAAEPVLLPPELIVRQSAP